MALLAQSTTKDYIRDEHKLHSVSKLFTSQAVIPQVMFIIIIIIIIIIILTYLNSAGIQHGNLQGGLLYSAGLHRNQC